ncbi:MAG: ATP-binding protein [Desulfobacteraceae bacterium]|nr:ATP-binding protein [Desulfobacteraceae bacterium]
MATAEQIKSLIRSHLNMNAEQFYASALQIAAHEARQGHDVLANDIKALVDRARKKPVETNVIAFPRELAGLILTEQPARPFSSLVVDDALKARIERVILEFRQQHKLKKHGLDHRRKLLLSGEPGTGKTMTAQVLATELKQPLHIIQMDRLVTKFMGETGAKLRQIFERMRAMSGVYLFDEFDAIGGERDLGNDVGEMRRVLNAFLQFIENDTSDNLIIAATNNPRLLDRALFRRFDDVLQYALPDTKSRIRLLANLLGTFRSPQFPLDKTAEAGQGLSHSEIDRACRDAIKLAILSNKNRVIYTSLKALLKERHAAYQRKER